MSGVGWRQRRCNKCVLPRAPLWPREYPCPKRRRQTALQARGWSSQRRRRSQPHMHLGTPGQSPAAPSRPRSVSLCGGARHHRHKSYGKRFSRGVSRRTRESSTPSGAGSPPSSSDDGSGWLGIKAHATAGVLRTDCICEWDRIVNTMARVCEVGLLGLLSTGRSTTNCRFATVQSGEMNNSVAPKGEHDLNEPHLTIDSALRDLKGDGACKCRRHGKNQTLEASAAAGQVKRLSPAIMNDRRAWPRHGSGG